MVCWSRRCCCCCSCWCWWQSYTSSMHMTRISSGSSSTRNICICGSNTRTSNWYCWSSCARNTWSVYWWGNLGGMKCLCGGGGRGRPTCAMQKRRWNILCLQWCRRRRCISWCVFTNMFVVPFQCSWSLFVYRWWRWYFIWSLHSMCCCVSWMCRVVSLTCVIAVWCGMCGMMWWLPWHPSRE